MFVNVQVFLCIACVYAVDDDDFVRTPASSRSVLPTASSASGRSASGRVLPLGTLVAIMYPVQVHDKYMPVIWHCPILTRCWHALSGSPIADYRSEVGSSAPSVNFDVSQTVMLRRNTAEDIAARLRVNDKNPTVFTAHSDLAQSVRMYNQAVVRPDCVCVHHCRLYTTSAYCTPLHALPPSHQLPLTHSLPP
jgi:hypothetical protein